MAISKEKNTIHGVELPYCKVASYSGNKDSVQVLLCYQASMNDKPLISKIIDLQADDSKELSDSITSAIYDFLKDRLYLNGEDC